MNDNKNPKSSKSNSDDNLVCPECERVNVTTSNEEYTFPYGVGADSVKLSTIVPVRKCGECGFSYLDRVGEQICHEVICQHLEVMPPSQVKGLRKLYNLTQAEFAEVTKLGEATLSRWERGIVIQNQAYDNYLYLLGFNENLKRIRERGESTELMKPFVKRNERPQFRELDVNEEFLNRKNNFMLCAWES